MRSPIRNRSSADNSAGRIYGLALLRRKSRLALGVAVAIALAIGLGGCRGSDAVVSPPATARPSPTATVSVPVSSPTGSTTASPASTSLEAQLDQIERGVEEVRGLGFEGETKRRFVDSATMAAVIGEELDKPENQEQIAQEQKLYRLLGLIEPDADLDSLYRGLLGSQVLGLYDPEAEEFLVLNAGDELSALAESTYAHEYTHRLQDVRFDLDGLSDAAKGNSDRELALAALIEGDATLTQLGYGIRFMSRARLTELMQAPEQFELPPAETPFVLLQGLEFPYTAGPIFVAALRGNASGFEAVDRAFDSLPMTSEQIMHPEKYRAAEAAAQAGIPDVANALGEGWSAGDPDVLGEFLLKTWLSFLGRADAAAAAAGWGGDSYQLFDGPGGRSAFVGRIVWDRPEEDAEEFFESVAAGLDRSSRLRRVAGRAPGRRVWEGDGRAIGVELAAVGTGTLLAAAPEVDIVERLLDSMAKQ